MKYEKARFVNNIYELARKQKMKIGDLEARCGVSNGYLARLRQGEKNIAPGADILMNLADQLSVSVDALLTFDFLNSTGTEKKLQIYLDKLLRDTQTRKLLWQRDPAPASVPVNPDGSSAHPLFVAKGGLHSEEERSEDGLPDTVSLSEMVFRSMFHPDLEDVRRRYTAVPSPERGCCISFRLLSPARWFPDPPGGRSWSWSWPSPGSRNRFLSFTRITTGPAVWIRPWFACSLPFRMRSPIRSFRRKLPRLSMII